MCKCEVCKVLKELPPEWFLGRNKKRNKVKKWIVQHIDGFRSYYGETPSEALEKAKEADWSDYV